MMSQSDAAAILGVEVDASTAEVQRAFRSIAREVHPDSGINPQAATLDQAKAARDALLSARKRTAGRIAKGPRPWPPEGKNWPPTNRSASNTVDTSATSSATHFSSSRTTRSAAPSDQPRRETTDFAERINSASERGSNWIVALTIVAILVVFLIVGAILIVGALFGSNPDQDSQSVKTDCVVIDESGLAEASCLEPNAQRIVSRSETVTSCPEGQNTLIVGETTWCLELAVS